MPHNANTMRQIRRHGLAVYRDGRSAAASAASAAAAAAADKALAEFSEDVVQVLIEMGAPGCEWLDMAPLQQAA